eukprot:GHVP01007272.1.p1 GENE.GHVP01007272.1~~GHVP01007272.1.p1  ORF type:complete len:201 (+),score=32.01 GHVP01007272.1:603-1205(+)
MGYVRIRTFSGEKSSLLCIVSRRMSSVLSGGTTNECDFFLFDSLGHFCYLRTHEEVADSVGVELPPLAELPGGNDKRWLFCDMRITALCGDSLSCKQCDGTTRCIWYAERLLFGPKFCTDETQIDLCNMEFETKVTEEATEEIEVWVAGIGLASIVLLAIPVSFGIYSCTKKSCIQGDSFSIDGKLGEMTDGVDFIDPFV